MNKRDRDDKYEQWKGVVLPILAVVGTILGVVVGAGNPIKTVKPRIKRYRRGVNGEQS